MAGRGAPSCTGFAKKWDHNVKDLFFTGKPGTHCRSNEAVYSFLHANLVCLRFFSNELCLTQAPSVHVGTFSHYSFRAL